MISWSGATINYSTQNGVPRPEKLLQGEEKISKDRDYE
jgi:hypothetical protein